MPRHWKRSVGYAARRTLKHARERRVRKPPKNAHPSTRETHPTSANWPKNSSTEVRKEAANTGVTATRHTVREGPALSSRGHERARLARRRGLPAGRDRAPGGAAHLAGRRLLELLRRRLRAHRATRPARPRPVPGGCRGPAAAGLL